MTGRAGASGTRRYNRFLCVDTDQVPNPSYTVVRLRVVVGLRGCTRPTRLVNLAHGYRQAAPLGAGGGCCLIAQASRGPMYNWGESAKAVGAQLFRPEPVS